MDRASLLYAREALAGADVQFRLSVGVLGLCLLAPLLVSMYQLYRALSGAEGRRRVRFEPVIKD